MAKIKSVKMKCGADAIDGFEVEHSSYKNEYIRLFQFLSFYYEQTCPNITYESFLDSSHIYCFNFTVNLEQSKYQKMATNFVNKQLMNVNKFQTNFWKVH